MVVVSICLLILSVLQYSETKHDRIDAEKALQAAKEAKTTAEANAINTNTALQAAQTAKNQAESAAMAAKTALASTNDLANTIREQIWSLAKISYMIIITKNEFGGERYAKAIKNVEKELNFLLQFVEPDLEKRKKK